MGLNEAFYFLCCSCLNDMSYSSVRASARKLDYGVTDYCSILLDPMAFMLTFAAISFSSCPLTSCVFLLVPPFKAYSIQLPLDCLVLICFCLSETGSHSMSLTGPRTRWVDQDGRWSDCWDLAARVDHMFKTYEYHGHIWYIKISSFTAAQVP